MSGFKIIVIGSSAGGLETLTEIFSGIPSDFPLPVVVVQHLARESGTGFVRALADNLAIHVKEAEDKEIIKPSVIYIAPADYHLLVDSDFSLSLSVEEKLNYVRPSIDILFESAARAFGYGTLGIILTGANNDGAEGLRRIRKAGGTAIVQKPSSAYCSTMPETAMEIAGADYILEPDGISARLKIITGVKGER